MKKKQDKRDYRFLILGGIIVILLFLLIVTNCNDGEKEEKVNEAYHEAESKFCNNTIFLNEDENGEKIEGRNWMSFDGSNRFEFVNNLSELKIQKGINYVWWIESDDFYVAPVEFVADCIDEADTTPNYIQPEAYRRDADNRTYVRVVDSYSYDPLIEFQYDDDEYVARMSMRYYPSYEDFFMPFGGDMLIEYDEYISDVFCTSDDYDQISVFESYTPVAYPVESMNNRLQTFSIGYEVDQQDKYPKNFVCIFRFRNPNNIERINGSSWNIKLIPDNFWVSKTSELRLDTTKEYDEDYESYTAVGIIEVNGTFIVEEENAQY